MKKVIFISLIITFLCIAVFISAEDRPLEVDYPKVPGLDIIPTTVGQSDNLGFYAKYIFNFGIGIVGLVGFGVLLAGGIKYLTSAANPTAIKSAKDQMRSSFLGILLLLFSYLILTTINPQLVMFDVAGLPKIPIATKDTPPTFASPDILVRIKMIAQTVDNLSADIQTLSEELTILVESCDCGNTVPECDCKALSCQPVRCYETPGMQLCPREAIEKKQRELIEKIDEIDYYRLRIISEKEDLDPELQRIPKENSAKLKNALNSLIILIKGTAESKGIVDYSREFVKLPDECSVTPCRATCDPNSHCTVDCDFYAPGNNNLSGCVPDVCIGGNPCPMGKINALLQKIREARSKINLPVQEIINILS
ncbi:MAG: hypothetical protein V1756_01855 [Patescibacteria group bacterium]